MGILTSEDKEKIKRAIPKSSNHIIDATVARLYIAYPEPTQWQYTGLMGAITLVDDLVGHTYFLKLVDIIGHRGVIWDQELYVDFEYNQDRTFFHTFEMEECLVGLLFEDTSDASHFYKRMVKRHKHGSKQTNNNKNAIALKQTNAENVEPMRPGPRGEYVDVNTAQRSRRAKGILYYDDAPPPEWRSLYAELAAAGITEDMIADNREFIKDYISKKGGPLVGLEPPIPRKYQNKKYEAFSENSDNSSKLKPKKFSTKSKKAPPAPPPISKSPKLFEDTSESENMKDNVFDNEEETPDNLHSNTESHRKFRVPPLPSFNRSASEASSPPPPALPTRNQTDTNRPLGSSGEQSRREGATKHAVPPPMLFPQSTRNVASPQLLADNSGLRSVPPPPPPRANTEAKHNIPPAPVPRGAKVNLSTGAPPPPPPRSSRVPPPAPPPRSDRYSKTGLSSGGSTITPQATGMGLPPPPAVPKRISLSSTGPLSGRTPSKSEVAPIPPPPPPMPSQSEVSPTPPPPPPLPMPSQSGAPSDQSNAPFPETDLSRDALLASIRGAGGIGSLKSVNKSHLDKPSAILQESSGGPSAVTNTAGQSGSADGPEQPGSLADALASALHKRKGKVAASDEEDGDDW